MCFQEVVEEPATDGDSDHIDREGRLNTKNICELVAIVLFFNTTCGVGMSLGTRLTF